MCQCPNNAVVLWPNNLIMDPPSVFAGDWLQTFPWRSERALKFYDAPPDPGGNEVEWEKRRNFYVGPVHVHFVTGHFLTVVVPHPEQPWRLVWCNVWTCAPHWENGPWKSMPFCRIVSGAEREAWAANGWENEWI